MNLNRVIRTIELIKTWLILFTHDEREEKPIGYKFNFNVPFAIYVGNNGRAWLDGVTKKPFGGIINGQDANFNIEHYRDKFIQLSIFKGTWRVTSVYDGGYAGCYFCEAVREDAPVGYNEFVPFLTLKHRDE